MTRRLSIINCPLSIALLCVLLTGCRKDLCYDHDEHSIAVKVHIDAAWEQEWERTEEIDWEALWRDEWSYAYDELRPEVAEGIRAIVYETEGSTYNLHNLSPEGGRLPMGEGTHPLLFYNNDTEYIVFNDLPSSATATASTRTRTRTGFAELHAGERTITPPDMLYGAYIDAYEAQLALETDTVPLTLRPLTYTYLVRYEFKAGQKYVALARGALAGMAEQVYLQDGHTGPEAATLLYDCVVEDWGVEAVVQTFGVPNHPGTGYTRTDEKTSANVGLQLSYVRKATYFVGYDNPCWWWYYPYYWTPGYWGDWAGWHYPYSVYYGYTAGSLLLEMVDLEADRQSGKKLPIIWDSFIGGLLTSNEALNLERTLDAVEQAFIQSPYLSTK